VYQGAQRQEELFALRSAAFEPLCGHTICSRRVVIGHVKMSLVTVFERERCTKCWTVVYEFLA
jgi:hypothetical protein